MSLDISIHSTQRILFAIGVNLNDRQLLINLSLLWNCHTSFRRKLWDNERPIRFIYSRVLRYLIWQGWWHPGHLHHKLRLSPQSTHSVLTKPMRKLTGEDFFVHLQFIRPELHFALSRYLIKFKTENVNI